MASQTSAKKKAHFEIDAALFEELGERLVGRPEVAITELIKNSFDADASECTLILKPDSIVVIDDGHGMTEKEFLANWMLISTQAKGQLRYSRIYGRPMAGSKGVGRFSARYLGANLRLVSRATDGERVRELDAEFDWNVISSGKKIGLVEIAYSVKDAPAGTPTGTALRITNLRGEARRLSAAKIRTDVLRLTNPIAGLEKPPFKRPSQSARRMVDPGFSPKFRQSDEASGNWDGGELFQQNIIDGYLGRFRLTLDGDVLSYDVYWKGQERPIEHKVLSLKSVASSFTAKAFSRSTGELLDERGIPLSLEKIPQLPVADQISSPVFIDLRFFPKRTGTFANMQADGRSAQSWVLNNGSFGIVDNGFAMPAYIGKESDWLKISDSKARNERDWLSIFTSHFYPMTAAEKSNPKLNPSLALPRTSQIIGSLSISTRRPNKSDDAESDSWLIPNMNREALRDNSAFNLLWHIARFGVETIAHFDRRLRVKEEEEKFAIQREEAALGIKRTIAEIRQSEQIDEAYKPRIVAELRRIEDRYTEIVEYEREAKFSIQLMSMMGVMAGFMTHEFEKGVASFKQAATLLRDYQASIPGLADRVPELLAIERSLGGSMEYMRLFLKQARNVKPKAFKARGQVMLVAETLDSLAETHHLKIDISIEPALSGPLVPLAAYHGIVINLLSNAMKAIAAKAPGGDRLIRILATNTADTHSLICADTGIGIPDYLRKRIWDPLFTTTADDNPLGSGLGLGLTLVKTVVEELSGNIRLLDTPPPGFASAFKVELPLHQER